MSIELPTLPLPIPEFIHHVDKFPKTQAGVIEAVEPYKAFENKLREIYAQHPTHPAAADRHLVPVFDGPLAVTRARDPSKQSVAENDNYLLSIPEELCRKDGSPATVSSLKEFKTNFNVFSESSLVDLDWNNVIVAGSAVATSLVPVSHPHNESKVLSETELLQSSNIVAESPSYLLPRETRPSLRCRSLLIWSRRRGSY
jgi:hypothetical protein